MVELIMVELIIHIIKGLENSSGLAFSGFDSSKLDYGRVGLPFSRYHILNLEDGRVV